jgi:hypothetical protein
MMKRASLLAAFGGGLILAVSALTSVAAAGSITANPSAPTTTTGVYFTVTTGGGNRDFASVAVNCTDGGSLVYATVLTVSVPPKGTADSQRIYPPESSCVADLVKLMQIGKARVLASVSFDVAAP